MFFELSVERRGSEIVDSLIEMGNQLPHHKLDDSWRYEPVSGMYLLKDGRPFFSAERPVGIDLIPKMRSELGVNYFRLRIPGIVDAAVPGLDLHDPVDGFIDDQYRGWIARMMNTRHIQLLIDPQSSAWLPLELEGLLTKLFPDIQRGNSTN